MTTGQILAKEIFKHKLFIFSQVSFIPGKGYLIFLPLPISRLFLSLSSHLPCTRNEGQFLTEQENKRMVEKEGEESNVSGSLLQPQSPEFNSQSK